MPERSLTYQQQRKLAAMGQLPNETPPQLHLSMGWSVLANVDSDGHLNLYITNADGTMIEEIDTGQGDGQNEQMATRFTTLKIEEEAMEDAKAKR